jgi:IclR family transcriptional regulator, KDG regulon repressor
VANAGGSRVRGRQRHLAAPLTADVPDDAFVVRALAKGLCILGLFDAEHREWSLDEIAEAAGLPRMTAYRMIRTMERGAYLVLDTTTNRYHLGPAMLAAMYLNESYAELVQTARPYVEALADVTGESVTLAVEVDGMAVGVDMVNTSRPFRRVLALGRIIGDTANSGAKVFAAFKPQAERDAILAAPQPRLTPRTIADPESLAAEFESIRLDGVAFDMEERNVGTCAVAAPVRDQIGAVIAVLSVVVPTGRFGPEERKRYAEAVRASADSLSAYLGYSPPQQPLA